MASSNEKSLKKCKYCQTEIDVKAKVCPNCKKRQGLPVWAIVLIVFFAICFLGAIADEDDAASSENKIVEKKTNEKKEIEYIQVDVDELDEALKNNAAAAKDKYNGKYLAIEGRIGTIDSDLKYIDLLSTTNEWDFSGIHCSIKNKETKNVVKSLNRDQIITVKGKITDVGEVLGYYLDIIEIIPQ